MSDARNRLAEAILCSDGQYPSWPFADIVEAGDWILAHMPEVLAAAVEAGVLEVVSSDWPAKTYRLTAGLPSDAGTYVTSGDGTVRKIR